jgi:pyruvate/2-oxoglutarate/acetoin dehydrogenase E1 component
LEYAIRDNNPVIMVEHRMLYYSTGHVPEGGLLVPPGRARVLVPGQDVTLVGISYQSVECVRAQNYLADIGISAEVIDPIWLSPIDIDTIEASVRKTKNLIVVDNAWTMCGAGSEIISQLHERLGDFAWKSRRMGFAPTPCPTTPSLEDHFYPDSIRIATAANDLVKGESRGWRPVPKLELKSVEFKGPF